MKKTIVRWSAYLLGMLALAFGIVLGSKADLGISPISSVAFCMSEIMGVGFGSMNFVLYGLFVAAQFALRGRNSRAVDLLQLVVSVVFSWVLDVFIAIIPYEGAANGFGMNFLVLLLSVVFIGVGVSASINVHLIPNPGDGIVQALAEKTGWEQGFAKNVFDIGCAGVTAMLGLAFFGRLVGIGIGTVVTMLGVGRVVTLHNRLVMNKLCAAVGIE